MLRPLALLVLLVVTTATHAYPSSAIDNTHEETSSPGLLEQGVDAAYRFLQDCGEKPITLCAKMRALTLVDKALKRPGDLALVDGVALVPEEGLQNTREANARALSEDELDATLPQNLEERETQVESLLVDRVARYLSSHTLQLKVPDEAITQVRKSLDEARGKKKKLKMLLPLLMLLKLKAAALLPIALGGLALLALKALIVGKLALLLAGLIGIQKLLGSKQTTQSYEVVAHPHYSHSSSYGDEHGHYGRSIDAQDLAYRGQKKDE